LPRFDYDPITLVCKGLLIEEARTNLLLRSEEFNDGYWSKANATVTSNSIVAPDNNTTADTVTSTGSGGRVQRAFTVATSTAYTLSLFAKKNTFATANINVFDGSTDRGIVFNFDTETFTSISAGVTATAEKRLNGWFRFSVAYPSFATTSISIQFLVGNLTSTYFWGAQLEAGAFATSYIPTVASTVTRNADIATMTGTNFSDWFNATEGTFVSTSANLVVNGFSRALTVSDNTTSNFINVTTNLCQIRAAGTFYASFSSGGAVAGQFYQTTVAYKANDCASSTDGAAIQADATVVLPVVTQMVIGGNTTTSTGAGTIKNIRYYPMRLTNNEVRAFSKQG
jgi:hypothetical protein